MPSITSVNSVFTVSVAQIFDTAQRLRGFSADDMFTNESIASAEISMGVDGRLSAGFVFVPFAQRIMLQADSPSNDFFDQWWAQEQQAREKFPATGLVSMPAINKKWNLVRGFLTNYKVMPDAQKILRPREYQITWQAPRPAPSTR